MEPLVFGLSDQDYT